MKEVRRKYDASFKAKVAIEAIREHDTLSELAAKYEVSPVMISRWKKEYIDNSVAAFEMSRRMTRRWRSRRTAICARLEIWRCSLILPSGYQRNWG